MSDQSIVPVMQEDRKAANIGICTPEKILSGALDSHPLVQTLARHRIAEREACAMVAEEHVAIVDHVEEAALIAGAGRDIAAAIRTRSIDEEGG